MSFPPPRRLPWLLLISAVILAADRATKIWIASHIAIGDAIPVIPRVLRLTHWLNDGAAFSLFADTASPHTVRWALIVFTCIAAVAVLIALIRLGSRITLATVALALILGGAAGNVHDRIAYGSVVDFIEVHILQLSLAGLQCRRQRHRDRRVPAAARFAAAEETARLC